MSGRRTEAVTLHSRSTCFSLEVALLRGSTQRLLGPREARLGFSSTASVRLRAPRAFVVKTVNSVRSVGSYRRERQSLASQLVQPNRRALPSARRHDTKDR